MTSGKLAKATRKSRGRARGVGDHIAVQKKKVGGVTPEDEWGGCIRQKNLEPSDEMNFGRTNKKKKKKPGGKEKR